jgi:hypothetical protein
MSTDLVVARGQQIVGLLLSTVPLAERMLLYNLVLAAWIMLPERTLEACRIRLRVRPKVKSFNPSPVASSMRLPLLLGIGRRAGDAELDGRILNLS